jgi:hypothetical protein
MFFAGVSKTSIPLQGMPNGEYADRSGIAYLVSGSISIDRNSGPKRLLPGDLVQLQMPRKDVRNPNTNRAGIDPNHITMQTVPFDPANYGLQLIGAYYTMQRDSNAVPPGIEGVPFENSFKDGNTRDSPDNPAFTNAQWMAMSLRSAMDSIAAAYLETLLGNGIQLSGDATVQALFTRLGAIAGKSGQTLKACRANAMLNVRVDENRAQRDQMKTMSEKGSPADRQYADLRLHGSALLVNGILGAKHEVDRWVIGRCLSAAAPGDTLDIDIGRGRTGC